MPGDVSKYHHKIPQTYLKKWCFCGETVHIFDKDKNSQYDRNISKILGENYFHSIKAGSLYTSKAALEKIFACLEGFEILYEGKKLATLDELNQKYFDYDAWEIYYPNRKIVSRKKKNELKQVISSTSDDTLEKRWNSEFENGWPLIADNLYTRLHKISIKDPDECFTDADFTTLMKYFIMFDWRGEAGNSTLNSLMVFFDEIFPFDPGQRQIPLQDRVYRNDETVIQEIAHASKLRFYEQLLDNRDGMKTIYDAYLKNLTFAFLLDRNSGFITSDNPAYESTDENGKSMFWVVTPKVLIRLLKKDPDNTNAYIVKKINDEEVEKYNRLTYENATSYVISKQLIDADTFK